MPLYGMVRHSTVLPTSLYGHRLNVPWPQAASTGQSNTVTRTTNSSLHIFAISMQPQVKKQQPAKSGGSGALVAAGIAGALAVAGTVAFALMSKKPDAPKPPTRSTSKSSSSSSRSACCTTAACMQLQRHDASLQLLCLQHTCISTSHASGGTSTRWIEGTCGALQHPSTGTAVAQQCSSLSKHALIIAAVLHS